MDLDGAAQGRPANLDAIGDISRAVAKPLQLAGWAFATGILLFSGSLYLLAISGVRWLGAITPLGGLAFIAGWACLAATGWKLLG